MRKFQVVSRFAFVAVLALGLTGCASVVPSFTGDVAESVLGEGSGSGHLVTKGKESFATGDFDKIQVDTQAMAVYVTKSSGDQAEVELLVDKDITNKITFDAHVNSKTLSVKVNEQDTDFRIFSRDQKGERKLLISLPDKTYNQLKITNEFGLVDAQELKADNVDVKIEAGTIQLNKVSAEMQLEVEAGKIKVEGARLDHDLTAKVEAGEINIVLDEAPAAAKLNLRSSAGKVTADLDHVNYTANSLSKKIGTIGTGGYKLDATVQAGSIHVE